MAQERWRDVVGFEGLYLVSNIGQVMSLPRTVPFGRQERLAEGRILTPSNNHGYLYVHLSNGEHSKLNAKVHRLVAQAFIPNPDNLPVVDHINCNPSDNRAENLRWCSVADNTRYARENGLFPPQKPEHIQALIDRTAKAVIRSDGQWFNSVMDAARELNVTDNAVHAVLHGRNKTCRGYTFRYA